MKKEYIFAELDDDVAVVTINRPPLNALHSEAYAELYETFYELSKDERVKVIVLTGHGDKAFVAGADVKEFLILDGNTGPLYTRRNNSVREYIRQYDKPVICAVNGLAYGGGCALALVSDIRIASPEAYFIASFINIGLSGGELGSSFLLPRLVGLSRASDILYTGRKVTAEEAEKIGLVNKVVPREDLLEGALSYARTMAGKSAAGLKLTKRVLEENLNAPSLETAVNLENRNQTIMIFSGEFFKLINSFHKGEQAAAS